MNNILSGAAMGAGLTIAGVYAPDIILSQFTFHDFTMLQTFLSAAAGSALLVTASQTLHLTALPPRGPSCLPSALSWLHLPPYGGNILGGALLGAGMAVSGACPGTVLAQLGVGVRSGRWALAGAVGGGVVWSWVAKARARATDGGRGRGKGVKGGEGEREGGAEVSQAVPGEGLGNGAGGNVDGEDGKAQGKDKGRRQQPETLYDLLGISRGALLVCLEAVLVLAIAASVRYTPAPAGAARGIPPYLAGLAIAAAQLVSMVLRGSLLGASSAFEELGGWVWGDGAPKKYAGVLFSAGVVAGAWLISAAVPALRPVTEVAIPPLRSALGGFMIIFGSRMAGGCTSGHGISGLSLMSVSSFLTAAAIFGAGGLVGSLIG